jgi:cobalt/nickel transport protein
MKKTLLLALVLSIAGITTAFAHFQVIYTPNTILTPTDRGQISLTLVFTHPFDAGHTMDMGEDEKGKIHKPRMFAMINRGEKTDLLSQLKAIQFTSLTNTGTAYELTNHRLRGMGDFVFILDPGPYYEASEEAYIQQFTKMIVNRGGAATDWHEPAGLPVEILPLDKPYALWTGNVFRGVVTKRVGHENVPVPHAEIEVEYLNHDIQGQAFAKQAKVEAPQDALGVQTILADQNGMFTYGIPRAGWWGFAALGAGGDTTHNGKELSMDAVIWVQAVDMK